jgi:hypothetical protein
MRYLDRVRDLHRDPFFPCPFFRAFFIALTAANRRLYDDRNYYVEVTFLGRVMSRKVLPFNPDNANLIGRALNVLDQRKGDA